MAFSGYTLFLVVSLSMFMLMNTVHSQTSDTTSFQIDSFRPSSDGLTYERDASVSSGSSYLSLIPPGTSGSTSPKTSSVGRVLYSKPVKFWDEGRQASFETTIRLRIKTADGMTFFIVPVNSTKSTGGEGGNLGIFDAVSEGSPIFAVEFDVHLNIEDPEFRHIGIDINSLVSQNATSFENSIGQTVTARINYDAPTRRISVVANYGSESASVEYVYDLKALLPREVQIGLSASTGPTLVAGFDVYQWYFTSTMVRDGNNLVDEEDTYIRQYVAS